MTVNSELTYLGFGLGIHSYLPLPELVLAETNSDVRVCKGEVSCSQAYGTASSIRWDAAPDGEVRLLHEEVGKVLVRGGSKIIVEPTPSVDERVLRLFILGPALSLLLHQRGLLVLHASAVAVRDSAIAFLGMKGSGKSTMAAAMHLNGHGIVADDAVAVDFDSTGSSIVVPAFPQLKLWPDSAAALGVAPEELSLLHPQFEKRARRVARGFQQSPLPLRRIYVLAEDIDQKIEILPSQEAFVELVRHSHAARFVSMLEATRTAASHFRQCVKLTNCVPVCRLKRPRSLSALATVTELVEQDLAKDRYVSG